MAGRASAEPAGMTDLATAKAKKAQAAYPCVEDERVASVMSRGITLDLDEHETTERIVGQNKYPARMTHTKMALVRRN